MCPCLGWSEDLNQVLEKMFGFATLSKVIFGLIKSTIILQEQQT